MLTLLGTDGNPGKQDLPYSEVETAAELRFPQLSCSSWPGGKGLSPAAPRSVTRESGTIPKLLALLMRTDLPGAGDRRRAGLGAQHHASSPWSPLASRGLCCTVPGRCAGRMRTPATASRPSPSLVAMPARRGACELGGLKCLQEILRAALLGGGAQRRLLPAACCTRGRERGAAASPAAATEHGETSPGLHPGAQLGKGEKW